LVTRRQVAITRRRHGVEIGMPANGPMSYGAAMSERGERRKVSYNQMAAPSVNHRGGDVDVPGGAVHGRTINRERARSWTSCDILAMASTSLAAVRDKIT